jgi:hypothetical protein
MTRNTCALPCPMCRVSLATGKCLKKAMLPECSRECTSIIATREAGQKQQPQQCEQARECKSPPREEDSVPGRSTSAQIEVSIRKALGGVWATGAEYVRGTQTFLVGPQR